MKYEYTVYMYIRVYTYMLEILFIFYKQGNVYAFI